MPKRLLAGLKKNMRIKKWIKQLRLILCFCFTFCVFGCGPEVDETKESYLDKISIRYAADEDNYPDENWPDARLKERFAEYWYKRFSGELEELWIMEAPHFQFMANPQRYRNYLIQGMAQQPIEIEIKEINKITDYNYSILCQLEFWRTGKHHSIIIGDSWVFVDNEWYHILRDPFVFPFTK